MLIEHEGKFLLVRISYAPSKYKNYWTFPGGGVDKKETYQNAAVREAKEEVGIEIHNPVFLGEYENRFQYKRDTVQVFYGKAYSIEVVTQKNEISEAKWYMKDEALKLQNLEIPRIFELYNKAKQDGKL